MSEVLNLDSIVNDPLEVELGGKIYSIKDPGMSAVTGVLKSVSKIDDAKDFDFELFLKMLAPLAAPIPEDMVLKLSMTQAMALLNEIGKHFLMKPQESGVEAPASPLPGNA